MDFFRVLFVSPHHEDAGTLYRMLEPVPIRFEHVPNLQTARERLDGHSFGAVLTDAHLPDGDWKDVLELARELAASPAVIVTHRFADDSLWAEVLNLGCYDLLAQPFDDREVRRILALACEQPPSMHPKRACSAPASLSAAS